MKAHLCRTMVSSTLCHHRQLPTVTGLGSIRQWKVVVQCYHMDIQCECFFSVQNVFVLGS